MQLGSRTTGGIVTIVVTNGGTGYTAPPTPVVGGGTGAVLYSQLAGTAVESVVVQSAGSGYSATTSVAFTGGGGTGASGIAYGHSGAMRPISFFKGRYRDLYGVDGSGRGVRWDGAATTMSPIGIAGPAIKPSINSATTSMGQTVRSIQIANGGNGYGSAPTVVLTGGSATRPATAVASVSGGRVTSVLITDNGAGYQSVPTVTFSGGIGSGASFDVGVVGSLYGVAILEPGSGYPASGSTSSATCLLHNTNGLTGAQVLLETDDAGRVVNAIIVSSGTGATATGVTASVESPVGSGAQLAVGLQFSVESVTASSSGSGYYVPPVITFRAATNDTYGSGAAATASVDGNGSVSGVTVYAGGRYFAPPTAEILNTQAVGQAEIVRAFSGKYLCAIRYIDDTPQDQGGPRASVISELAESDAGSGQDSLAWSFSHGTLDDRVKAMELWRTTADQSVLLFRVATVARSSDTFSGTYFDFLTDDQLKDPERDGYGLMPIVLPSGQINARRFGIPPGEFSVGCMFQDRAWYAVDSTGRRPNSLMFSEVDEPESVPSANELIVQENTGEPDKVVALVPLGAYLLIAQQSHLYKLSYVAQPVIDASITLVGYRGLLNNRCWDVMGGVAFMVDSAGMYAFDGNAEEAVSVAVDDYWRNGVIDFSKSDKFHVSADFAFRTVRFFYCQTGDTEPVRALCYCVATKSWWEETFSSGVTATCPVVLSGRRLTLSATQAGEWWKQPGGTASSEVVEYSLRTGAMPLEPEEGERRIGVIYDPTTSDSTLNLRLHYNNSTAPRVNAIHNDRGSGFTTVLGSTDAQLNMKKGRSELGDATGYAEARYAGRATPGSAGADRHVSVAFAGSQASTDPIRIHAIRIDGVG